ncbi:MFS transporter [Salipaludibacillus daqingensis]|uniref:MFS transporter n=1 Tax=Salipaludibacillus daqingensis TaxID=3041001 RepID=UPI002475912D|nr:MFS transporter [Salipaludibacillus daqingensis]
MHTQLKLLLSGRIITNLADSLYLIAAVWYVSETTQSPFLIGVTGAISTLPAVLSFSQGPIIDRYEKRTILVTCMFIQAVSTGLMMLAYNTNTLSVPLLLLLLFFALMASEMSFTTGTTLIKRWAKQEELTKVNCYFSFTNQALDVIADGAAGFVVVAIGIGLLFGVNSVVLLSVGVVFLLFLRKTKASVNGNLSTGTFLQDYKVDFVAGYRVVRKQNTLLAIFVGIIFMNVSGSMGLAMIPAYAVSPQEYGLLLMATSVGALTGALIAPKAKHLPIRKLFPSTSLLIGIFWMTSFFVSSIQLSLLFFCNCMGWYWYVWRIFTNDDSNQYTSRTAWSWV